MSQLRILFIVFILLLILVEFKPCEASSFNSEESSEIKRKIYLIRHAKPDLHKDLLYTASEAQKYLEDYNKAPIIEISHFDMDIINTDTVYCSNLRRAEETAKVLFQKKSIVVSDSIFREFPNQVCFSNSIIPLPLFFWQVTGRISWFLRASSEIESCSKAKERVVSAADFAESVSDKKGSFVLVAHGLFNRSLMKKLKKRGWKLEIDEGRENLGVYLLTK